MLQRAVEILFRAKWLILLPIVVIVPITTAITFRPQAPKWRVISTIWVDPYRPLDQNDNLGVEPAMSQAQLIRDFIHTDTFSRTVLEQTSLKPMLQTQQGAERAQEKFWQAIQVTPTSVSFLTISVTTEDPDLSYAMAHGINATYQDMMQKQLEAQTATADKLYGDSLSQAANALSKSQAQLAGYLTQHPELVLSGRVNADASSMLDGGNLSLLTDQVSKDRENYNAARQRYLDFQQAAAGRRDALPFTFTVVDQPQRPVLPVHESRLTLLKIPIVGLILALMLSSGIAALLVLTSHTILDGRDVETYLGLPVVGTVSELGPSRCRLARRGGGSIRVQLAAPARPRASAISPARSLTVRS